MCLDLAPILFVRLAMAAPLDSASAASSLRGGASTQEGAWVSGSLEEQIHQSKIREERLEAALKDAQKGFSLRRPSVRTSRRLETGWNL